MIGSVAKNYSLHFIILQGFPLCSVYSAHVPSDFTEHRKVKYLNNRLEADHGKLKRLIIPVRGFKKLKTAYATIKGFELMRMFKKGQLDRWKWQEGLRGEMLLINQQFNLGAIITPDWKKAFTD